MNVFKTPSTLSDGQQQRVDNFAPRVNLKCFFEDSAISSGDSEVKEAASQYFCFGEACA
jgi:ABC-type polar amino acid transport system ATPase subunit